MFVGTTQGLWTAAAAEAPRFEGRHVTAMAGNADAPWIALDGRMISQVGGAEAVEETAGEVITCLVDTDGGLLAGTSGAHLRRLTAGELVPVPAFDATAGRDRWFTPWGGPPDVRSIAVDAAGGVHVNVHVGGIISSRDGGTTWTPAGLDLGADVHQIIAHPNRPGVLIAACARGLALSRDGGASWDVDGAGLHATYARAVALADDMVLLTVSRGPGGGEAAVYRRPLDADGPLERCTEGLPGAFDANIDTHGLVAGDGEATFGTVDGSLFRSTDQGATWREIRQGLPPITCLLPSDAASSA